MSRNSTCGVGQRSVAENGADVARSTFSGVDRRKRGQTVRSGPPHTQDYKEDPRDPVYFASAGHFESALLMNSSAFGVHIGWVSRPGSR